MDLTSLGFNIPSLIVFVVNFLLLLAVLYIFAYKPILRVMDRRSNQIRESLEAADRAREEAASSQATMRSQLQDARAEGQSLIEQARQMAERYREEERARARQEGEAFVARARDDIQRERDAAIQEVRSHFADLAISAAERVIERSLDRDAHRDLIDRVLQEGDELRRG